jgi:hypothetical protein
MEDHLGEDSMVSDAPSAAAGSLSDAPRKRDHPPTALWQQEALSRANDLYNRRDLCRTPEDEAANATNEADAATRKRLFDWVDFDLASAEENIQRIGHPIVRFKEWISGSRVQSVDATLNAAEVTLLRLAPDNFLRSELPVLVDDAKERLPDKDSRLVRLTKVAAAAADAPNHEFTVQERAEIVSAVDAAKKALLRAQARLRSFRNVVLIATGMAALMAVAVALIGLFAPDTLPLCYTPDQGTVCPASGGPRPADSLLVEFAGVLGATISAVFALRKVRGSADPYSLAIAQALLKLPTGALTAFLGLLLIKAGFVPGLSALDTSAQILAWAVVLGYSQELFTHWVDKQAQSVLAHANYGTGPQTGMSDGNNT